MLEDGTIIAAEPIPLFEELVGNAVASPAPCNVDSLAFKFSFVVIVLVGDALPAISEVLTCVKLAKSWFERVLVVLPASPGKRPCVSSGQPCKIYPDSLTKLPVESVLNECKNLYRLYLLPQKNHGLAQLNLY